jgi:hypothetical protein
MHGTEAKSGPDAVLDSQSLGIRHCLADDVVGDPQASGTGSTTNPERRHAAKGRLQLADWPVRRLHRHHHRQVSTGNRQGGE